VGQLVCEQWYRIVDRAQVPIGNDDGVESDPDAGITSSTPAEIGSIC
jgi:hypothetical protein